VGYAGAVYQWNMPNFEFASITGTVHSAMAGTNDGTPNRDQLGKNRRSSS
jgi:hypothetical protein